MKNKAVPSSEFEELRRQAEARLAELKRKTGPLPSLDVNAQRLVHELEVHQIELEMQNDELMQARAELEAAVHQLTDLYDLAPVGYFTLTRDGTIIRANLMGANLLGMERNRLIKRRFGFFISVKSRMTFNAFLERVSKSQQKESCDLALQKDGHKSPWVRVEATCSADGLEYRVIVFDITARRQAEEELKYLSTHDALTGLYNRGYFAEEMDRLERGRLFPVSILMADIDHLKKVNDHQGHAAGDELIKRVAQVLTAAFRSEDVVARLGGDEFAVLLPGADASVANASLRRVRQAVQECNALYPETPICLSLGLSTAEKRSSLAEVLKEADKFMYSEKRGKNG